MIITIDTDKTVKGTMIKVNEVEIDLSKIKRFGFGFNKWEWAKDNGTIDTEKSINFELSQLTKDTDHSHTIITQSFEDTEKTNSEIVSDKIAIASDIKETDKEFKVENAGLSKASIIKDIADGIKVTFGKDKEDKLAIASYIFAKDKFDTKEKVKEWLLRH